MALPQQERVVLTPAQRWQRQVWRRSWFAVGIGGGLLCGGLASYWWSGWYWPAKLLTTVGISAVVFGLLLWVLTRSPRRL